MWSVCAWQNPRCPLVRFFQAGFFASFALCVGLRMWHRVIEAFSVPDHFKPPHGPLPQDPKHSLGATLSPHEGTESATLRVFS